MGALEVGLAVQVQQAEERMGALEAGLAAQVQHAEESMATVGQGEARMVSAMEQENCVVELQQAVGQAEARMVSAIRLQHDAVGQAEARIVSAIRLQRDAEESRPAAVKEQVSRLEQEGCVVVALVKQVEVRQAELGSDLKVLQESTNQEIKHQRLWVQGELKVSDGMLLEEGQRLQGRLRAVEDRPDMTERLESIETSVQVCVNSVRVLHSYAEAKDSSDSDGEGT